MASNEATELGHVGMQIRGTHPYAFRSGEWAEITGVRFHAPEGCEPRWVYDIIFPDGVTDSVPVFDSGYEYEFREGS